MMPKGFVQPGERFSKIVLSCNDVSGTRENVLSYLIKSHQSTWWRRLLRAYEKPRMRKARQR
jgi:hypothetical protein